MVQSFEGIINNAILFATEEETQSCPDPTSVAGSESIDTMSMWTPNENKLQKEKLIDITALNEKKNHGVKRR